MKEKKFSLVKSETSGSTPGLATQKPCNICNHTNFKKGPNGRLSVDNLLPVCAGCNSAERHRVFRFIFDSIRTSKFKEMDCVTFSRDRAVAGGWFKSYQYGGPGGEAGLDMEKIDRPDKSVDVVISNGSLTRVARFDDALSELGRITSSRGFSFITFANPHYRKTTQEWGFPKESGEYRAFGEDVEPRLCRLLPNHAIFRAIAPDPVTGYEDRAYIVSENYDFLSDLGEKGLKIKILQF